MREAKITSFVGGINQSLPAEEIQDTELADAVNFELDALGHLNTRPGMQQGYSSAPTPWDAGVPGTPFEHFPAGSTNPAILIPKGLKLYSFSYPAWSETDITGALVFPNGAKWQWVQMDDAAIGVNGANTASGKANTIQVATLGGTATEIAGAPNGKYIEYFGRRVFIVDPDAPDSVKYCAVGDHTDWTTTGASGTGTEVVGNDEYGPITGLKAWQGRLFIFKQNAIYQLVPGAPVVDNRQWQIVPYATNIGCVSAWTIQQVGDDVIFLSAEGITSLRASGGGVGEFTRNALSLSIPALGQVPKSDPELFTSVVWPQKFQYWVGVPSSTSSTPTTLWVMDYRAMLSGGRPSWMKYDGDLVETRGGYCVARIGQTDEVVVVNSDYPYYVEPNGSVYQDLPEDDSPTMSVPNALSKAFHFDAPMARKEFYSYVFAFEALTAGCDLNVTYRFDEKDERAKTTAITISDTRSGSRLDGSDTLAVSTGTTFTLLSDSEPFHKVARSFRGSTGRRGQSIQFRINSTDASKGFIARRFKLKFDYLDQGQFPIDTL